MDIITFLLFLIWLAGGVLVVRFVIRTGGSAIGKVAHWFGGTFVMIGFAVVMLLIYANLSPAFGGKLNTYLVTHLIQNRSSSSAAGSEQILIPLTVLNQAAQKAIVQFRQPHLLVTVFRRNVVNTAATISGDQLSFNQRHDVRTSLWWMLWNTSYNMYEARK